MMDWGDAFTPQVGGTPQTQDPDDFIGQQADLARQQYMAQALRQDMSAYSGGGQANQGMMISGHYVPNYQAMGQQVVGGMYSPQADQQLTTQNVAFQRAQMATAQQAIQNAPQRFAPMQLDDNGQPVQNGPQQSFADYKTQMGQYAAQLMSNPMTNQMGMKLAGEISDGTLDQAEQSRIDKLNIAQQAQDTKKFQSQLLLQGKQYVADVGAQAKQYGVDMGTIQKILTSGVMDQGKRMQLENSATNTYLKQATPYGQAIDHANALADNVANADQNGYTPVNTTSMIDNFQKMVNPTGSVKESQYHRIASLAPVLDQIDMKIQGIQSGQMQLTPDIAHMMVNASQVINQEAKKNLYSIGNAAADQAQQSFLDPTHVVRNASWRDPDAVAAGKFTAQDPVDYLKGRLGIVNNLMQGKPALEGQGAPPPPGSPPASTGAPTMTKTDAGVAFDGGAPMPQSYKDPAWDTLEQKLAPQYAAVLNGIRTRGEKSNSDQLSSANAATPYQFIPSTRQDIIQRAGFDPLSSPENAVKGAAWLWQDKLNQAGGNQAKALQLYSGGATGYSGRVLGQTAQAQAQQQTTTSPVTSSPTAAAPAATTPPKSLPAASAASKPAATVMSLDDYIAKHKPTTQ